MVTRYSGEWKEAKLGEIGTFIKGAALSKADIANSGTPFILYGELYTTYGEVTYNVYRRTKKTVSSQHYSRVGDVIMPTSGETAEDISSATCVMIPGVILAGDLCIFRTDKIDGRFLSFALNHIVKDQVAEIAQGISIIHVRIKDLANITVRFPPMDEQIAIAETLSALDRHLSNLSALIAKKQAIRQGALEDLMTGRTRLWGFTGDWKTVKLGDVFDFKNGLNKAKEFFGHGTPIINYMDVYHHSAIRASDIHGTVELTANEIRRFNARKNDVFFTRTSETPEEVGFAAVLLDDIDDCVFSGFVLRARPKNDLLLPEYCQYCFAAKAVRREIIKYCTYTTRALTNGRILSAIVIPLPPLEEQSAIAHSLAALDSEISALNAQHSKLSAIRSAAINDLLSGKIRLTL